MEPRFYFSPEGAEGGAPAGAEGGAEGTAAAAGGTFIGGEKPAEPAKYEPPAWQLQAKGEKKYDPTFGEYKVIDELMDAAKNYRTEADTLKKQIEGKVFVPGKDSTPEEVAAWKKSLNIPETPDAYKDAPKLDLNMKETEKTELQQIASENNFTQEQYEATQKYLAAQFKKEIEADKAKAVEVMTSMKEKWGENFQSKIQSIMRVKSGIEALGVKGFSDIFNDPKVGNNMVMIEALEALSVFFDDDRLVDGSDRGNEVGGRGRLVYPKK